ncbi:hypothetical protein [Micromonospora sp. DT233]|uniref:hypothetical protein n=1 Tax=Micromonospora sp. DT233 TaxID=3393432 RepID=UPI003CF8DC81
MPSAEDVATELPHLELPPTLRPEVEQRLRELAEVEHRSLYEPAEVAVQGELDRRERDEWTRQAARRVFESNAEFFEMLGDR